MSAPTAPTLQLPGRLYSHTHSRWRFYPQQGAELIAVTPPSTMDPRGTAIVQLFLVPLFFTTALPSPVAPLESPLLYLLPILHILEPIA